MKLFTFLLILFLSYNTALNAQELRVITTRFVGGAASCGGTVCKYAMPTRDGGILFVGWTSCFAGGGDIPPSPPDNTGSSPQSNVLIGKLDSNMNVSWVKVYGGGWDDIGIS